MKLIACDMDGTLLNSNKVIDQDFIKYLPILLEKGVMVGIASGRQYLNLRKDFKEYADKMFFIADNGSVSFVCDKMVDINEIDDNLIREIIASIHEEDGLYSLICGINGSYIKTDNEIVIKNAEMYCNNLRRYDDLEEVIKNDRITKLSVFDINTNMKDKAYLFDRFKEETCVVVSASEWLDFTAKGISKGKALHKIKELYGLKDIDCIAFGDFNNDIEMMQEAYFSYAMANATNELKKVADFMCESNDDSGVSRTIKRLYKL